jgi:hypothetical protein
MSGTAQLNSDKDGIFGMFMNIYDGSVFRRLRGDSSGNLGVSPIPTLGYTPIQISSTIVLSHNTGNLGIGLVDRTVYTVPANFYFYFGQIVYVKTAGNTVQCTLIIDRGGGLSVFDEQGAIALNTYIPKTYNMYINEADIVKVRLNVTVNPTQCFFYLNGYLIPKT